MATPTDPQTALKRRILKPLPAPGAGKRVRAQKRAQPGGAVVSNEPPASNENKDKADLNIPTPKTTNLPLEPEAPTPSVPVIQLNGQPLPKSSETKTAFVVDEAKDAELREKFLKLQLHKQPKPISPKLKIPKQPKAPPKPIQRRMARVKSTVKTAPRPEISFGTTVTTFGEETEPATEIAEKNPDEAPVNLKALKRRQERKKKERLGISRTKRQLSFELPTTSDDDEEDARTEKQNTGSTKEDTEEARRKATEKTKQITLLMARDIQKWNIPKKKLREMAKGKTEEETEARRRVLGMAWKIAIRQQQREKERTRADDKDEGKEKETGEDATAEGPKECPEADKPKLDEPQVDDKEQSEKPEKQAREKKATKDAEKRRKAKGKERAPGWSVSAPTAKPSY